MGANTATTVSGCVPRGGQGLTNCASHKNDEKQANPERHVVIPVPAFASATTTTAFRFSSADAMSGGVTVLALADGTPSSDLLYTSMEVAVLALGRRAFGGFFLMIVGITLALGSCRAFGHHFDFVAIGTKAVPSLLSATASQASNSNRGPYISDPWA